MISRQLWNALRRPPTSDSLFRQAYSTAEEPFPWYVGCANWLAVVLILPVLAFAGTIYSLGWAVGIANVIGRERARHRFELISLTPGGPLGASWTMALGYLYRHRTFRNVNQPGSLYTRAWLIAFALAGFGVFPDMTNGTVLEDFFVQLAARVVLTGIALTLEHTQSVVLGVVAGITAASRTEDGTNAQLFAFALYTGIQLFTYVGTLVIGFVLVPAALRALKLEGIAVYVLILIVRVIVLAGLREIGIAALWRGLVGRLNATPPELTRLLSKPQ